MCKQTPAIVRIRAPCTPQSSGWCWEKYSCCCKPLQRKPSKGHHVATKPLTLAAVLGCKHQLAPGENSAQKTIFTPAKLKATNVSQMQAAAKKKEIYTTKICNTVQNPQHKHAEHRQKASAKQMRGVVGFLFFLTMLSSQTLLLSTNISHLSNLPNFFRLVFTCIPKKQTKQAENYYTTMKVKMNTLNEQSTMSAQSNESASR